MTKGQRQPNWCQKTVETCPSLIFCRYEICVLNFPSEAHYLASEANFWVTLYRLSNESRIHEIRLADNTQDDVLYAKIKAKSEGGNYWVTDILKRIWRGERCYFLSYRMPKIFPTYSQNIDDFLGEYRSFKNQSTFEKRIRDDIRIKYGTMPTKSDKFNPLIRAIGLWAHLNGVTTLNDAISQLSEMKINNPEDDFFCDTSDFSKVLSGTRECIEKRRICRVPKR